MVQKRGTKAINKLCVREILSLSFVCGAYFFEFRGRKLVCFGIEYNFDRGRHWQIRAGSREGTHAHCVFHACTASHDTHEKISSWVPFSFLIWVWGSAWRPSAAGAPL